MKSAAVGILFCSSFLWAGSGRETSETLVITNVNVVDTRYGGVEPNVTVIVKDSIITAISKFALVNAGPHESSSQPTLFPTDGNSANVPPQPAVEV